MKTNQINYFLRVCDTLNFTRAAEICHVSQPSLSAAIQKLEDELGGSLFDRNEKPIQLTTLGESMRVHLSRIEEAQAAAAIAASAIVQDKSTTINIGVMCTVSPHKLLHAISALGAEFEGTELLIHDLREVKALELLLSGAVDCILMAHTSELDSRFSATKLSEEPLLIAMHNTHSLAGRDEVTYAELQGENYIDRLHCEFRENLFDEFRFHGTQLRVVLRSEREDLVAGAVASGVGISMMPKSSAENAGLSTSRLEGLAKHREISMITVKDRLMNPLVKNILKHISDHLVQASA